MAKYYTFRRRHAPPYAGHNHLAGLAYSVVSVGLFAQVLSGLLLFGWIMQSGPIHTFFGWGNAFPFGGIQGVRTLHYILTFLFAAFAIHHVYSRDPRRHRGADGRDVLDLLRVQEHPAVGLARGPRPHRRLARGARPHRASTNPAMHEAGLLAAAVAEALAAGDPPDGPRRRLRPAPGPAGRSRSTSSVHDPMHVAPESARLHAELALRARGLEDVEITVSADPVTCVMCDVSNEVQADHPFCAECGWPLPDRGGHAVDARRWPLGRRRASATGASHERLRGPGAGQPARDRRGARARWSSSASRRTRRSSATCRTRTSVELVDGGTVGLGLLPLLMDLDGLSSSTRSTRRREPGTLIDLDGAALIRHDLVMSVHDLGAGELLGALHVLEAWPSASGSSAWSPRRSSSAWS